jgi:hypothetical protein
VPGDRRIVNGHAVGVRGDDRGELKRELVRIGLGPERGERDPPFLHDKVIGLISTAGGTHGLQAINTMEFAVRGAPGMGGAPGTG